MFDSLFFKKFSTPFSLGAHIFLISNLFSTIASLLNVARGEGQVLFGHQKSMEPSSWIRSALST
jgi:hypothetical protein